MKASVRGLRLWPGRNFLAELERQQEGDDLHPFDMFARREPRIRRLKARLRVASGAMRGRIAAAARLTIEDTRAELEAALFETAFNVGFEHGLIAERAASSGGGGASPSERRFRLAVRRLLADSELSSPDAGSALLDFCRALMKGIPLPNPTVHGRPLAPRRRRRSA